MPSLFPFMLPGLLSVLLNRYETELSHGVFHRCVLFLIIGPKKDQRKEKEEDDLEEKETCPTKEAG